MPTFNNYFSKRIKEHYSYSTNSKCSTIVPRNTIVIRGWCVSTWARQIKKTRFWTWWYFSDEVSFNVSGIATRKACKILGSFSINLNVEHNFQPIFLWRERQIQFKVRTIYEDKTQIISRTIFITSFFHSVYICYCSDLFGHNSCPSSGS
jgi:hypothetical protein